MLNNSLLATTIEIKKGGTDRWIYGQTDRKSIKPMIIKLPTNNWPRGRAIVRNPAWERNYYQDRVNISSSFVRNLKVEIIFNLKILWACNATLISFSFETDNFATREVKSRRIIIHIHDIGPTRAKNNARI